MRKYERGEFGEPEDGLCPACHKNTLEVQRVEKNPTMFDYDNKIIHYRCSNCGKTERRFIY